MNPPTPEFDRLADDAEVTFMPLEAVWPGRLWDASRLRPKSEVLSGYTRFREGDILVPKITPTFEADRTVIATGLANGVAAGTTELHVVRTHKGLDTRYLRYVLSSRPFLLGGAARMIGVAGQKRVPEDWLLDLPVAVTEPTQQRRIGNLLDDETTRIDALIEKKRRMIATLEERHSQFSAAAVTAGLDAKAPKSRTGSPFAPTIPRGWQLVRLKHVVHRIVDTEHATAPTYPDGDHLVVRTANVKKGRLLMENALYTDSVGWSQWTRRAVPQPGDVMLTREAPAGEACLVPQEPRLCIGQRMVLLVVDRARIEGEWLVRSLYGGPAQQFIALLSRSTTVAHINMADIPNVPVVLPPLDVQRALLNEVRSEADRVAKLVALLAKQVNLLREHRAAVISSAVAGDHDVTVAA